MTLAKNVLGIVPGVMALGLVGESVKTVKDIGKKKKVGPDDTIKLGVKVLVGVPLIGAVAGQINLLP